MELPVDVSKHFYGAFQVNYRRLVSNYVLELLDQFLNESWFLMKCVTELLLRLVNLLGPGLRLEQLFKEEVLHACFSHFQRF